VLERKLGECRSTQAQLHGVQLAHFVDVHKQEPRHHALHVFKVNVERLFDVHRALHPRCAEVQVAGVAVVREIDFGELDFFLDCQLIQ